MDLEQIAENTTHAQWIVTNHVGNGTERPRCVICDTWWPCNEVGLAARAVLNAREANRLREQLGIATNALGAIADSGGESWHVADDALTQMSVVEP